MINSYYSAMSGSRDQQLLERTPVKDPRTSARRKLGSTAERRQIKLEQRTDSHLVRLKLGDSPTHHPVKATPPVEATQPVKAEQVGSKEWDTVDRVRTDGSGKEKHANDLMEPLGDTKVLSCSTPISKRAQSTVASNSPPVCELPLVVWSASPPPTPLPTNQIGSSGLVKAVSPMLSGEAPSTPLLTKIWKDSRTRTKDISSAQDPPSDQRPFIQKAEWLDEMYTLVAGFIDCKRCSPVQKSSESFYQNKNWSSATNINKQPTVSVVPDINRTVLNRSTDRFSDSLTEFTSDFTVSDNDDESILKSHMANVDQHGNGVEKCNTETQNHSVLYIKDAHLHVLENKKNAARCSEPSTDTPAFQTIVQTELDNNTIKVSRAPGELGVQMSAELSAKLGNTDCSHVTAILNEKSTVVSPKLPSKSSAFSPTTQFKRHRSHESSLALSNLYPGEQNPELVAAQTTCCSEPQDPVAGSVAQQCIIEQKRTVALGRLQGKVRASSFTRHRSMDSALVELTSATEKSTYTPQTHSSDKDVQHLIEVKRQAAMLKRLKHHHSGAEPTNHRAPTQLTPPSSQDSICLPTSSSGVQKSSTEGIENFNESSQFTDDDEFLTQVTLMDSKGERLDTDIQSTTETREVDLRCRKSLAHGSTVTTSAYCVNDVITCQNPLQKSDEFIHTSENISELVLETRSKRFTFIRPHSNDRIDGKSDTKIHNEDDILDLEHASLLPAKRLKLTDLVEDPLALQQTDCSISSLPTLQQTDCTGSSLPTLQQTDCTGRSLANFAKQNAKTTQQIIEEKRLVALERLKKHKH